MQGPISKPIPRLLPGAVAFAIAAFGLVACGGGGDKPKTQVAASQTQTNTSTTGQSSDARSGRNRSSGTRSPTKARAQNGTTGSGGARAPRASGPPRKRSLQRFLAVHYRQAPWYPLLRRLRINGGHVGVYLNLLPSDDDENPPVMACSAVLSYGRQVKSVTVYPLPTPQGKTVIMKQC